MDTEERDYLETLRLQCGAALEGIQALCALVRTVAAAAGLAWNRHTARLTVEQ